MGKGSVFVSMIAGDKKDAKTISKKLKRVLASSGAPVVLRVGIQ
jgi:translation initiation factor 1 (eIF-1/SUI1)